MEKKVVLYLFLFKNVVCGCFKKQTNKQTTAPKSWVNGNDMTITRPFGLI